MKLVLFHVQIIMVYILDMDLNDLLDKLVQGDMTENEPPESQGPPNQEFLPEP